jgi:hypothetical protein
MGRKMIFKCSKCRKIIKGTGKTGMCQSCIMTGEGNSMFGKKRPDNVIRFSGTKNHMFKTGKRCKNYHNYCFCGNEIRYNSKHCIYCDAQINRNGRDIGSKYIHRGYILIKTNKNTWIAQHRYLVEKYIERKLNEREIVHHIDGDKGNNNLKNLYVFANKGYHTYFETLIRHKIVPRFSIKSNLKQLRRVK